MMRNDADAFSKATPLSVRESEPEVADKVSIAFSPKRVIRMKYGLFLCEVAESIGDCRNGSITNCNLISR